MATGARAASAGSGFGGLPPSARPAKGVYTLPVLYALQEQGEGGELADLLADGPPDGDGFTRALDLVRTEGSLARAREAVTQHVRRTTSLAGELGPGLASDALVQLAEFLAVRCGAES